MGHSAYVQLADSNIPATPPAYAASTDPYTDDGVLPYGNGQVGNPIQFSLNNKQVLGVQPNGTVSTENRTNASNETWRFERQGYIDDYTPQGQYVEIPGGYMTAEPVYDVVNYNPATGTATCLSASQADNIASGSAVTAATCNPDGSQDPGQLWIVNGGWYNSVQMDEHDSAVINTGVVYPDDDMPMTSMLEATTDSSEQSLVNVASVLDNGLDGMPSLALSSAVDNVYGQNSTSMVTNIDNWPANANNSLYNFNMILPPPTTTTNNPPTCSMFACITEGI
jgi:hypothetical protein